MAIDGLRNFLRGAEAAGVEADRYARSMTASVHPANPTEPPFPNEDTPVRGTPRYLCSKHQTEVDRMMHDSTARHPEVQVVLRLRK